MTITRSSFSNNSIGFSARESCASVFSNNVVFGNIFRGVNITSTAQVVIVNNTFYDNGYDSYYNPYAPWSSTPDMDSAIYLSSGSAASIVFNNIFRGRAPGQSGVWSDVSQSSGVTIEYNNISSSAYPWAAFQGSYADCWAACDNFSGNPRLYDPNSGDFHIVENSAARNNGASSVGGAYAPAEDFDGQTRPNAADGSIYDVGADEYYAP
jgi:parallel beta-helix repeat protein